MQNTHVFMCLIIREILSRISKFPDIDRSIREHSNCQFWLDDRIKEDARIDRERIRKQSPRYVRCFRLAYGKYLQRILNTLSSIPGVVEGGNEHPPVRTGNRIISFDNARGNEPRVAQLRNFQTFRIFAPLNPRESR